MAEWKELTSKAKNLTMAGLSKAKDLGQSAKLKLDNVSEEENRKRILAEIGKQYVAAHPDPEEGYEELYQALAAIDERMAANREQLEKLKD